MLVRSGLTLTFALLLSSPALADWQLDSETSHLSFGSIKAGDVGESHYFENLTGTVADDGAVEVGIDLASVETLIDIRDERMREFLFDTANFEVATITASIDLEAMKAMAVGEIATQPLSAELSLVGSSNPIETEVVVTRLGEDRVMVQPTQLIMLDAANYDLIAGIEKLRELASLDTISTAVPVTFTFVFDET